MDLRDRHALTACPQKGTKNKVDALNDRLMFRLQYRKLGAGDERMVVAHTVRASKGKAGLRWYELQGDGGGWAIVNQGTYAPDDTKSRWMGSVAMDAAGNIAAGYSLSSRQHLPVDRDRRAARRAPPANTLDLAERKVFTGLGSEKGRHGRWGDYSDMTVAEDGCTFYYTQQYYKKTGQWKWATRIVRFQLAGVPARLRSAPSRAQRAPGSPGALARSPVSCAPMRLSKLFVPTLRDDPADAEIASHRLLLRAGFVRQADGRRVQPPAARRCA